MTPSARETGNAEEPLHSDDPERSHPNHERSALLSSDHVHSPLSEEVEQEGHAREVSSWKTLPWWKRPSPYWIVFGIFLSSIGFSALVAPKVAMYTALVCRVHRPEYVNDHYLHLLAFPSTNSLAQTVPDIFGGSVITVDMVTPLLPNTTYTSWSGYTESEPDPEQQCASDPVVQAVVAKLHAVFITSMGVLSCLTVGWWGSLSDRYGRRIVLFISMFGLFAAEFTHIITAWFVDVLPGGYWFPLIGFLVEGLCGSMSSGTAAAHAYLADTIDPSTRSQYFSLTQGVMFTGVAVGPILGGLLIRSTGTSLSVFYSATILHGAYALLVLLIFPESLTRARARGARLRWRREKGNQAPNGVLNVLKNTASFLKPLVVLLPEESGANPLKRERRDWSLFFIAIAYALLASLSGAISHKLQYAAAQFGWTPDIISYYISFMGVTRAFFLVAILPVIITYFKVAPVQLPSTPDEPLQGTAPSRGAPQNNTSKQRLPASRSPVFDLALARASVGAETTALLVMAVASTGTLFVLANVVNSFGAGFTPAVQALALDIYTNRHIRNRGEVGKLFGAFSILQAAGSQIISPALYGFVYFNTVATFPQAIIVVSMCTTFLALVSLLFVRIPSKPDVAASGDVDEQDGQDAVLTPEILLATEHEIIEGH